MAGRLFFPWYESSCALTVTRSPPVPPVVAAVIAPGAEPPLTMIDIDDFHVSYGEGSRWGKRCDVCITLYRSPRLVEVVDDRHRLVHSCSVHIGNDLACTVTQREVLVVWDILFVCLRTGVELDQEDMSLDNIID